MRIDDVNALKGKVKTAIQSWGNNKIDELLGNKIQMKASVKNGLNNLLNRHDDNLNKYIDAMFLFMADESGVIDSDSMVDMMANMFKDIEPCEYQLGGFGIKAGRGELYIDMPQSVFLDIFFGKIGSLKFTADDLLEFKKLFNS